MEKFLNTVSLFLQHGRRFNNDTKNKILFHDRFRRFHFINRLNNEIKKEYLFIIRFTNHPIQFFLQFITFSSYFVTLEKKKRLKHSKNGGKLNISFALLSFAKRFDYSATSNKEHILTINRITRPSRKCVIRSSLAEWWWWWWCSLYSRY